MKMRLAGNIFIVFLTQFLIQSNSYVLQAQDKGTFLSDSATVDECIRYAFKNQPLVKQLKLDKDISEQNIRIALSDWFPQIHGSGNLQKNLKLPVIYLPNFSNPAGPKIPITTGVNYNSGISFGLDQTIFNRDVYLAGSTARVIRTQSIQTEKNALIDLVVQISKAYYNVLLSIEQLNIIREDIDRISKSLHDAYARYENGVSDNIDFKRATISLNNALAEKISAEEAVKGKESLLKQLIGYPMDEPLNLKYDKGLMKREISLDTLQYVNYENRIDYQLLQTNLKLQKSNLLYHKLSFLPSLSGFAGYNINYQNDAFSELYKKSFPNSAMGLSLNWPILQGTKRLQNIRKSKFELERISLDTLRLRDLIDSQYIQAMAGYKGDLAAYNMTLKNIDIAQDVYNTIKLQYNQGIKTYLEVIVSETDLMAAKINNLNALIMLMFSKLDVQRALGQISVDY